MLTIDREVILSVESKTEIDSTQAMLEAVRGTTTLDGSYPLYQNAFVSLQSFDPNELYPTAKYVLNDNLNTIRSIDKELVDYGIDVFNLNEVIQLNDIVIAPPIVELSDGVPCIVDGQHRSFLAREAGRRINCIYVTGVDPNYPIISTPVGWDQVIAYDKKPEAAELLRDIRPGIADSSQGLRRFYRDFSFLGSQGRRPRLGQTA